MENVLMGFVVLAIIVMAAMASMTKSLGGAFLGLAMLCIVIAFVLFSLGGWSVAGGVAFGFVALLSMVLAFGLGFNMSRSSLSRLESNGTRWDATQTLIGDGAKSSSSQWHIPDNATLPSPSRSIALRDNYE